MMFFSEGCGAQGLEDYQGEILLARYINNSSARQGKCASIQPSLVMTYEPLVCFNCRSSCMKQGVYRLLNWQT